MSRACDLIVRGGIFFLLLFTPLAFGAVHPWAYIVMEGAIFILIAAAMINALRLGRWPVSLGPWRRRLAVPALLFGCLIGIQILPIPPLLLSWLSPNSFVLYQTTLPGWPEQPPFSGLMRGPPSAPIQAQLLPTAEQLRQGAAVPFAVQELAGAAGSQIDHRTSRAANTWRSLSIAPALTLTDLHKFAAYAGLLFLVALYPFGAAEPTRAKPMVGQQPDGDFLRGLFFVLLAAGFIVALLGIVQKLTDNGKILWFFIPYDWQDFSGNLRERAAGPFINADHFANYLALIFPLALVHAVRPPPWFRRSQLAPLRIFAALTALVIFLALLLSLSRFGWFAALCAATGGLWWLARDRVSQIGGPHFQRHVHAFVYTAAVLTALLAVSVWLVGPAARQSIDLRLAESVSSDGALGSRVALWRDSLEMIRDFPIFGVGLGAWSEIFPRYQGASASETFYREAHNDYLQLFAETGLGGFFLFGLALIQCARMLLGARSRMAEPLRPLYLACLTALALMLLHEFCDFSLRIPANALLFTVILGISVRLAAAGSARQPPAGQRCQRWLPASVMAAAVVALVAAFGQDLTPFPYNLGDPSSVAAAAERIDRHPAQAAGHIMLARLLAPQAPMARQTQLYATAAWLRPSDANLRDLYASALLNAGERERGLGEVSRSVAMAPSMTRHFYLNDRLLPWLTADERQAIEAGFQQALARGDLSALENFALFYQRTGQPLAQAKLFNSAAAGSTDRRQKMTFILKAAASFAAAGESAEAEKLLRQAVAIEPSDARPYQALALSVYAPQGQRERIAGVIGEALSKTAQPLPLYLALAQAMHRAGASPEASAALRQAVSHIDGAAARGAETVPLFLQLADTAGKVGAFDEEIAALEQVAKLRPSAAEIFQRLGSVYLRGGQHDRAAHAFHRLTELRPQSAQAFFHLGQAEAARSANRAADAAYSRAVELAPNNLAFKARHDEIARQLAVSQPPKSSALDHAGK